MGEQGVQVDVAALRGLAAEFDRIAELVERQSALRLGFGGAVAGRAHVAAGESTRRALDRCGVLIGQWSRSAAEIGTGLRVGAVRYAAADAAAASGIG